MAGETVITVVGNLVDDPELRFTPSGAAVANFRIASTPRTFDRQTNEWKDGDALFLSCSVWRQAAENVAESLTKGMRVVVQGRLRQRSYEDREGQRRTVVELEVDEVGPSLRYATAKVTRASRGGGGYGGGNSGGGQGGQGGDPWSTPQQGGQSAPQGGQQSGQQSGGDWGGQQGGGQSAPQGGGQDPWNTPASEEPPFCVSTVPPPTSTIPAGNQPCAGLVEREHHNGQGSDSQAQEEGLPVLQGQDGVRRLQGRQPAPQVHLRPRQDPCASCDRQLRPAPA